jgi:methyl-accepting chemotaxis protein
MPYCGVGTRALFQRKDGTPLVGSRHELGMPVLRTLSSIKFLLIGFFGFAATVLVGISGSLMVSAWQQQAQAERRTEISTITRHLFQAMQNVRVERGTVSTALADREPVDAATWQDIRNLRARSAPALAAALDDLSRLDFDGGSRWIAELRTMNDTVETLRAEVDAILQKPSPEGTAPLNEHWVTEVGAFVDGMDALSSRLSSEVRFNDPHFDQMMTVKQLAWSVRADAGFERLMIGNAIASGTRASDDWQRKIAELRGRVGAAWAVLLSVVGDPQTPQVLLDSIALAEESYFDRYDHDRAEVYRSLIAADPRMTGRAWIQSSNPALESLARVADTAVDLAQAAAERMSAEARTQVLYHSVLVVMAVLIGVLGLFTIRQNVIEPIVSLTLAMRELAAGNTRVEIPITTRHDELGAMAKAVEVFKQAAIENARLRRDEQDQTAARADSEKQVAAAGLARAFDAKIGNLVQLLKAAACEMEKTARSMSETAEETDQVSTLATTFAEQTSTNVRQVAAASDKLAASAREIGSRAITSASLVAKAVEDTRRTDDAVKVLSERSERIEQVVKLISDVAAQTNLLALNATIEAARAGQAGRGFGVVALEVKALAAQTAKATEEISSQVAQSQTATRDVVIAIRGVGNTIDSLHMIVSAIAAAVEEQNSAAQVIAGSLAAAATGTQEVTNNISQVHQAAADTGSASSQVLAAATALSHNSSELGREVELFLASLAAA